jgi:GNAT superfamily N-acetyltransferase
MEKSFLIKMASRNEVHIIIDLIKELAEYEKLSKTVLITEDRLIKNCFEKKYAEILLAYLDDEPIGYAFFFHNFSTFIGKPGIWVEDIYIKHEYRNKGYGRAMLKFIAKIAFERDCGRIEWSVLDWNTPSIEFYSSLGAKIMKEWLIERMDEEAIHNFLGE